MRSDEDLFQDTSNEALHNRLTDVLYAVEKANLNLEKIHSALASISAALGFGIGITLVYIISKDADAAKWGEFFMSYLPNWIGAQ